MLKKRKRRYNINFKYNLKIYWSFLRKYKKLFFWITFFTIILELVMLVDKILFKIVVDYGTKYFSNDITREAFISLLIFILAIFLIMMIVRAAGRWFSLHLVNKMSSSLIRDLKTRFFNHLIHLSHRFHTTHKTGSLISRLSRGAGAIDSMTDFIIFNTLPLIIQMIIASISLIYFDWVTALIVVFIALLFIGHSLLIQGLQKRANVMSNQQEDAEKANMGDIFTNIESIKYFGKENNIKDKYANITNKTRNYQLNFWGYFRWLDAGHSFIITLGTLLLMYVSITRFLDHKMTIGTLVFIYSTYGGLIGPLFGFVGGIRSFYRAMADFESLFQYGKIKNDIKDKKDAKDLVIKDGNIEFRNVSFRYHKRGIIKKLNLKINKNQKIAFVGHSGSGKTTLVKLLFRFYDVQKGEILIDGKNINDFKQESLRSELSVVPQECVLFDDTIYNNILFSNPTATRREVLQAMKFAQLDKIINKFPNKDNTIVGERGVKLSGGEKQRVSIARAILANKKIIVLDEATSSLDSQTESEIKKDLERLLENRTAIIIAHRLSTIMKADKIVVFKDGEIVQMGNHNELIRQKGLYRKFWNLQKGGYIK
ncbi:MAG TPA: ABC transporter ATP-binding protein [Candidatus Nanoarchaeia archaeon]|nr:ABC transporter ATP-binding protein [Candidatus Nanoarchaeia archaeon]